MDEMLGRSMTAAVGVAISPVPVLAVLVVVTSRRRRVSGPAFLAGWLLALTAVGAAVLITARWGGGVGGDGAATWGRWLEAILGAGFLAMAVRSFRARPRAGHEPSLPAWIAGIHDTGPGTALGLGAVLVALNPKNIVLVIAGATAIARSEMAGGLQAATYALFVAVATLGVAAPLLVSAVMGVSAPQTLGALRGWLTRHTSVIVSVLFLAVAVALLADAGSALLA